MGTSITGAVLGFRRDPGFMHHRAQTRRDAGETFKALQLYRRASAAAPEDARYKADIADMLNHMGCARASYELIVRMINDGELSHNMLEHGLIDGDALYIQACNMSELGLDRSAGHILDLAQHYAGDSYNRDSYDELRTRLTANRLLGDVKRLRMRTLKRMERYTASGSSGRAYALAKRFLRHNDSPLAHAIMAWACALRGEQAESMEHLIKSLAMKPQDPWILSIAARILAGGDRRQARPALQGAFALSEEPECDAMLLGQAVALGMDSLVLDISERLLACTPWEPRLCAHRAVAMINTGVPARATLNALRQCLNVYPGDPTALHYIELVQRWKPGQPPLNYPDREMLELWARTVTRARLRLITGRPDPDDIQLVRMLEWGLNFADADVSASSAALLVHLRFDEARDALWRFLAAFELPDSFRYATLALMAAVDYPLPRLMFSRGRLHRLGPAALCEMLASREPRADLRAAVRRLHRYPLAISSLKPMLMLSGAHGSARLMASALELAYKIAQGKAINLRAYAHRRNLNCRQLTLAVDELLSAAHPSGRHEL